MNLSIWLFCLAGTWICFRFVISGWMTETEWMDAWMKYSNTFVWNFKLNCLSFWCFVFCCCCCYCGCKDCSSCLRGDFSIFYAVQCSSFWRKWATSGRRWGDMKRSREFIPQIVYKLPSKQFAIINGKYQIYLLWYLIWIIYLLTYWFTLCKWKESC